MVVTNAFRILSLWASWNCFSLILRGRESSSSSSTFSPLYDNILPPVAEAFTALPSKQQQRQQYSSFMLLRPGSCHDSRNLYSWSSSSFTKQHRRNQRQRNQRQRQHGILRLSTLMELETPETNQSTQQEQKTTTTTTIRTIKFQQQQHYTSKYDQKWMQQYEDLIAFRDVNGHCNVPTRQESLGPWVCNQRMAFKQGRMREDRKELLDEIGFFAFWKRTSDGDSSNSTTTITLNTRRRCTLTDDRKWMEKYEKLKSYKQEHGDFLVPRRYRSLQHWVNTQRHQFNSDRMPQERIDLMEEIGFVWDPWDEAWQNTYKELEEFQQIHGHVNVPSEDPISEWTARHRLDQAAGRLDPNKKAMLDTLGFVWDDPDFERFERQWKKMFRELERYKQREGHVQVPVNTSSLGQWVKKQRKLYDEGRLLEHRLAKLESIGFIWRLQEYRERDSTTWDEKWMEKYNELKDFQQEHGHANVLVMGGASLGRWVDRQRVAFRGDKLRQDRKDLLDEIGFVWEPMKLTSDEKWQANYEELQSYQRKYGHLNVSQTEDRSLYKWITRQRTLQQAGRIRSKRKAMLDKLCMEW